MKMSPLRIIKLLRVFGFLLVPQAVLFHNLKAKLIYVALVALIPITCTLLLTIHRTNMKRQIRAARRECIINLQKLNSLLDRMPYMNGFDKMSVMSGFHQELAFCDARKDYVLLLSRLSNYVHEYEDRIREEQSRRYRNYGYQHQNRSQTQNGEQNKYQSSKSKAEIDIVNALRALGLPNTTKDFSIMKSQYRKLIKMYHPDRNMSKEAEEKSKEINKAYDLLEKAFA